MGQCYHRRGAAIDKIVVQVAAPALGIELDPVDGIIEPAVFFLKKQEKHEFKQSVLEGVEKSQCSATMLAYKVRNPLP